MVPLFGIGLTVVACVAAFGTWGRSLQILGIIALGLACIHADLRGRSA